jgi:hypothetical protein
MSTNLQARSCSLDQFSMARREDDALAGRRYLMSRDNPEERARQSGLEAGLGVTTQATHRMPGERGFLGVSQSCSRARCAG